MREKKPNFSEILEVNLVFETFSNSEFKVSFEF